MNSKRNLIKGILESPNSFGTSLITLAINEYSTDVFDWEPQTVIDDLEARYETTIPQINRDRIAAMQVVYTTDLFYKSLNTFFFICNALGPDGVDFEVFDPVTAKEAAWAVVECTLNVPLNKNETLKSRFTPDIRAAMGVIMQTEGIITPPIPLTIAIMPEDTRTDLKWYENDPTLFRNIYQLSKAKAADIEQDITNNLISLSAQLSTFGAININKVTKQLKAMFV